MKSRNEYYKEYYRTHKNKWKYIYNNSEGYRAYQRQYYQSKCKEEFGYYLYYLVKDNKIVYIGSTCNMYKRISHHKAVGREFDKVLYKDLTMEVRDKNELLEVEYYFINLYKEEIENKCVREIRNNDEYFEDLIYRCYLTELKEYKGVDLEVRD